MILYADIAGERLDAFLARTGGSISRSAAQKLMESGCVTVNGKPGKKNDRLKVGDTVSVELPEAQPVDIAPKEMPLDIVYEDEDVLVINKPKGLVVHPAAGHQDDTLVNGPLFAKGSELSGINGELRPGIVHRIDKDTSGLLMIAKNDKAHQALAQELKEKKSLRQYVAIVHGNLPNDRGVIEAPIGRSDKDRKKQAVTAKGKPALTRFQVLERFGDFTLVELTLETGRTHQIRVHMAYIGHPIAGDPVYGPRKTLAGHGQFLHAKTLGFTHPTTGELMTFSVDVPAIFQETLEKLRK